MGVISNYYLNGATLATSTGVYMDANLSTCAPLGNYSDGVIVRELFPNCVLGPAISCPSCEASCGPIEIIHRGTEGEYNTTANLGAATGAVIISFSPGVIPDGIYASYDSVIYNALSSEQDGYHRTLTPGGVTYLGDSNSGICATNIVNNSPYSLPEYVYSGGSFAPTGSTSSITISSNDVSLSTQDPKRCIMVIPKLSAAPASILVSVINYCKSGSWSLKIGCPAALSSTFSSSTVGGTCSSTTGETYYSAPVSGGVNNLAVNDWVFSDVNGANVLANGDYHINDGVSKLITVTNGVITTLTTCP